MKEMESVGVSAETSVVQEVTERVKDVTAKVKTLVESLENLYKLEEDIEKLPAEELLKITNSPELTALVEIIEKLKELL